MILFLYALPLAVGIYGAIKSSRATTEEDKLKYRKLAMGGAAAFGAVYLVDENTSAFKKLRYTEANYKRWYSGPYTDYAGKHHPRGLTHEQWERLNERNEQLRLHGPKAFKG